MFILGSLESAISNKTLIITNRKSTDFLLVIISVLFVGGSGGRV